MSIKTKIRDIQTDGCKFEIYLIEPSENDKFNIPYVFALPENIKDGTKIIVESNNIEKDNHNKNLDYNTRYGKQYLIENAINEVIGNKRKIGKIEFAKNINAPFMMPVIPAVKTGIPYYQQLAKECFEIKDNKFFRVDEQLCNMIKDAKSIIAERNVNVSEKIFLIGYATSGIFAQRFAFLHPEIIDTMLVGGAGGTIPMPSDCKKSSKFEYPLGTKDYKTLMEKDFNVEEYKKIRFEYYLSEIEEVKKSKVRKDELGRRAPLHDMSYMKRSVPTDVANEFRDTFERNLLTRFKNQLKEYERKGYKIDAEIYKTKANGNGIIKPKYFENIYNGFNLSKKSKDIKRIQIKKILNVIKLNLGKIPKKMQKAKMFLLNKDIQNEEITDNMEEIAPKFEDFVNYMNFNEQINNLENTYKYKLDENEDIYDFPLQTKLTKKQTIQLAKKFFESIDPSFTKRAEDIISGASKEGEGQYINLQMYPYDKYSKYYQTKYDKHSVLKKNKSETEFVEGDQNHIIIDVPLKGDLRDLYSLVHEITHTFDTKNGDTGARNVLGEVIPQVMERNLDNFLSNISDEDKIEYGINNLTLEEDIKNRKITTFLSRYNNVRLLNTQEGNKVKNTRYMLAQIYQTQFMKLPIKERTEKIKSFLKAIVNDDFDEANKVAKIDINNYFRQDMYISNTIYEVKKIIENQNDDKTKEKSINKDLVANKQNIDIEK